MAIYGISQWVGTHLSLKEGVSEVLCCFGFESQLLKVEIRTPCDGMAVVTPFECYIQDDNTVEHFVLLGEEIEGCGIKDYDVDDVLRII